jgi:hypothetical protein
LSPAIVTKSLGERGYYSPLDYIPPSTLRGAIITSLYGRGVVDRRYLDVEAGQPIITTSPAYPFEDMKSYPSHLFMYRCKACSMDDEKIGCNDAIEVSSSVEKGEDVKFKQVCDKGHPALEPLHPKPVKPLGRIVEEVDVVAHESVCVGISKHRAASQKGMLYEYEAIAQGAVFWAYLKIPENISGEVKPGLEFSIGRGVTRGFGRARVIRVEKINIDVEEERIRECLNSRRIIFYAISSLASLSTLKNTSYPYPREIDLKSFGREFGIEVDGKVTFTEAYGKLGTLHCGWDIKKNVERPTVKSALPGSILIGRVTGSGDIARALAILGLVGTIEHGQGFFITGVNIITPLKGHPMGGE